MKKETQIIMIPTVKESSILKSAFNNLYYNKNKQIESDVYQHLYFLSNEEIKEGDYVYHTQMFNHIGFTGIAKVGKQQINGDFLITSLCGNHYYYSTKEPKVIATTDESLRIKNVLDEEDTIYEFYPRPSNEFVKKYCELGGIDTVLVEYEQFLINPYTEKEVTQYDTIAVEDLEIGHKLKVTPNNTIITYWT